MRTVLATLILAIGACGDGTDGAQDPGKTWRFAIAHHDCAPWDGAATGIELSDFDTNPVSPPYLRISAYVPMPTEKVRAEVGVNGAGGMGAGFCEPGKDCVGADAGWVELVPSQDRLGGRYDLTLHDGRHLTGSFLARILSVRQVLCG